jgi:hypothetical protein
MNKGFTKEQILKVLNHEYFNIFAAVVYLLLSETLEGTSEQMRYG